MSLLQPLHRKSWDKASLSLLCLCLCLGVSGFSQNVSTVFYDKEGREVSREQAYYVAIGTIPTGKNYFVGKVVEKYVSNKQIKAKKNYDETGMQVGVGSSYYPNGQLKEKYQLKNGHVFGGYVCWYPNGQKQLEREYTAYSNATDINHLTYNFWDSLGQQLVTDGAGMLTEYYDNYHISAQGKVYKGFRSGTWKGYYPNGNLFYVEKYKGGELISGHSTLRDSTQYTYTQINVLPAPKIGFVKYYENLSKALSYPKSAKKIGLQGTVYLAYTIDELGKVEDYGVIKSLSEDCDREAIRIFESTPVEWIPGTSRGLPKSFTMTLPVSFKK